MQRSLALIFLLFVASCDNNTIDSRIRIDALSRAGYDCNAANSCRVKLEKINSGWDVWVTSTPIGNAGDPQFLPSDSHHYSYNASGQFAGDAPEQ
jgi:hypothetical protein